MVAVLGLDELGGDAQAVAVLADGAEFAPQPGSSLVCQTRRWVDIRPSTGVGFLSVRFRPWGALHFLDRPVSELSDSIVPAEAVWGAASAELEERLALAGDVRARIGLVERFLLDLLRRHRKDDVERALRAVWSERGNIRVPELCHNLGVSQRTAQRVFGAAVGMPPKSYARLVRFLSACSVLRRGRWRSVAEVAYQCGYYDQAHLDGDFRELSGMTPTEVAGAGAFSFLEIEYGRGEASGVRPAQWLH